MNEDKAYNRARIVFDTTHSITVDYTESTATGNVIQLVDNDGKVTHVNMNNVLYIEWTVRGSEDRVSRW